MSVALRSRHVTVLSSNNRNFPFMQRLRRKPNEGLTVIVIENYVEWNPMQKCFLASFQIFCIFIFHFEANTKNYEWHLFRKTCWRDQRKKKFQKYHSNTYWLKEEVNKCYNSPSTICQASKNSQAYSCRLLLVKRLVLHH